MGDIECKGNRIGMEDIDELNDIDRAEQPRPTHESRESEDEDEEPGKDASKEISAGDSQPHDGACDVTSVCDANQPNDVIDNLSGDTGKASAAEEEPEGARDGDVSTETQKDRAGNVDDEEKAGSAPTPAAAQQEEQSVVITKVMTQESTAPEVMTQESTAPEVMTQESTAPEVMTQESAAPKPTADQERQVDSSVQGASDDADDEKSNDSLPDGDPNLKLGKKRARHVTDDSSHGDDVTGVVKKANIVTNERKPDVKRDGDVIDNTIPEFEAADEVKVEKSARSDVIEDAPAIKVVENQANDVTDDASNVKVVENQANDVTDDLSDVKGAEIQANDDGASDVKVTENQANGVIDEDSDVKMAENQANDVTDNASNAKVEENINDNEDDDNVDYDVEKISDVKAAKRVTKPKVKDSLVSKRDRKKGSVIHDKTSSNAPNKNKNVSKRPKPTPFGCVKRRNSTDAMDNNHCQGCCLHLPDKIRHLMVEVIAENFTDCITGGDGRGFYHTNWHQRENRNTLTRNWRRQPPASDVVGSVPLRRGREDHVHDNWGRILTRGQRKNSVCFAVFVILFVILFVALNAFLHLFFSNFSFRRSCI